MALINPIRVTDIDPDFLSLILNSNVTGGQGVQPSGSLAGDLTITVANAADYANKRLWAVDNAVHTITIQSGVFSPIGLVCTQGSEIKINNENVPEGTVNNLKAKEDGSEGILIIDVLDGNTYRYIGNEGASYLQPTAQLAALLGANNLDYYNDFANSLTPSGIIGQKGAFPLIQTTHTKGTVVTYNYPTVDVDGWLAFNGADQLVNADISLAAGSMIAAVKVLATDAEQCTFGLMSGSVNNNACRVMLTTKKTRLHLRYSGNVNVFKYANDIDGNVTPRVYTEGDFVMLYVGFNSLNITVASAKINEANYTPEIFTYDAVAPDTIASKPHAAVGGEFRGAFNASTLAPGNFKQIYLNDREMTSNELQEAWNFYKTLTL